MIGIITDKYDSSRWADKVLISKEERYTLVKGLEVARDFLLLIQNTTDTYHQNGRPTNNVEFLCKIDKLLDRLKYAEKGI